MYGRQKSFPCYSTVFSAIVITLALYKYGETHICHTPFSFCSKETRVHSEKVKNHKVTKCRGCFWFFVLFFWPWESTLIILAIPVAVALLPGHTVRHVYKVCCVMEIRQRHVPQERLNARRNPPRRTNRWSWTIDGG